MATYSTAGAWRARLLIACAGLAMVVGSCAADGPANEQSDSTPLDFDDLADRVEQENIEIDRLVSECMTVQGFTYIPPGRSVGQGTVPLPEGPNDRDHTEQWGYGILTGLEAEQPWLDVLKVEDVQRQLDGLQEQSDGEGRTYNRALYGLTNPADFAAEADSGCLAEATAAVDASPNSLAARDDRFEAASGRFAADTRVAELEADWARCMNESGYDFSRPGDIIDSLLEIADGFYPRLQSVQWSVIDRGDGPVEVAPDADLVAAFESDLAVEADRERELALADMHCFAPIAEDYQDLQGEHFAELAD